MSEQHLDAELWDLVLDDRGDGEAAVHLATCSRCAATAARRGAVVDLLKESNLAEQAPDHLEEQIFALVELDHVASAVRGARLAPEVPAHLEEASLRRALQDAPSAAVTPMWGRRTGAALLAAAAVIAALFAFSSSRQAAGLREQVEDLASAQGGVPPGHAMQLVALDAQEGSAEVGMVHFRHDNYKFLLRTQNVPPTAPGTHYELWLVGGRGDISAGSFRISRPDDITFSFQVGVDPKAFPELMVTLEDDDGDPARSGPILIRGRIDPNNVDH